MQILKTIDPAETEIRDGIRRDCAELHVLSPPQAELKLEVFNADGEQLSLYHDYSRSWVRNAYNMWFSGGLASVASNSFAVAFGDGSLRCKKTDGGEVSATQIHCIAKNPNSSGNGWYAPSASNNLGIVVGTSDSAESFESYQLGAIIANGTSSGQLSHLAMARPTPAWDGDNDVFNTTGQRYFTNVSGGSITIKECGIIFYTTNGTYDLVVRDVLSSPVTVPDNGLLSVSYTITSPAYA